MVDIKDKELKDDSHVAISTRNLVPYRRSATKEDIKKFLDRRDKLLRFEKNAEKKRVVTNG